jgi:hypothetical protein
MRLTRSWTTNLVLTDNRFAKNPTKPFFGKPGDFPGCPRFLLPEAAIFLLSLAFRETRSVAIPSTRDIHFETAGLISISIRFFGIGICTLFILKPEEREGQNVPPWLQINRIGESEGQPCMGDHPHPLCLNVLENIIIVGYENLAWEILNIPITIMLLNGPLYRLPKH